MTKTITFNTGRKYTAEGQVITATLHDDMHVTFMDHSRGIDGEYDAKFPEFFSKENVMAMYDNGKAPSSTRSWMDGMTCEGCNTRK